jgi:hypothetical protein
VFALFATNSLGIFIQQVRYFIERDLTKKFEQCGGNISLGEGSLTVHDKEMNMIT